MDRIGIVGFPNVGKTTLFNALTGLEAVTAAHPFSTAEPNVGVALIPDARLDQAAVFEGSKKTVHAHLEFLDLPSMARPEHGGGLGSKFLGELRDMDAIAVVLRAFEDELIVSEEAGTDPVDQAEELLLELTMADAEIFGRRVERAAKEATADHSLQKVADAVARATAMLEEGRALRVETWSDEESAVFREMAPLTLKPAVWVINVSEDESDPGVLRKAVEAVVPDGDTVVTLSAEIEEEASRLDPEDRLELFEGLGLGEGALTTIVHATYDALDRISFFTLGPREAHAWTVARGTTARAAAGKVHSDLERGFIRAEVAPIDDVVAAGGWDAAKAAGLVRLEGRDYVVAESDVMLVRFSI